jgi:serine protease
VDPAAPPTVVDRRDGALWLQFPELDRPLRSEHAVVVSVAPGRLVPERLAAAGRPLGAARRHWLVPAPGDVVGAALDWATVDGVSGAIPDVWLEEAPQGLTDDPDRGSQWYLDLMEMDTLHERSLGDPDIVVAVLDGATDVAHPDLAAGVVDAWDAVDGDDDPSPIPGEECPAGVVAICDTHGTAVSGIVGARADNGVGLVGMCPECLVMPIRIIGGPLSTEVTGFEHAVEHGADVLNNSWGYIEATPTPEPLAEVMSRAVVEGRDGQGAVVVFAAGNDDRDLRNDELTNEPGVLCVSAMDRYHLPTAYTNRGRSVDVAAFSATVSLAPEGGLTTTFGGTSAASPVVAGLAGWLLSMEPSLTGPEVTDLLVATAHKPGTVTFDENGHHEVYGYGEIDPVGLLAALDGEGPPTGSGPAGRDRRSCGCDAAPGGAGAGLVLLAAAALRRRRR